MGSNQVTVAALGRPFRLGMLYDTRTDQLLQGSALWDSAVLQSKTQRRPQPHCDVRMSESDSTREKVSMMDLQGSLRASAACGLVKGQGSAKFYHEKREFEHQCRVALHYKASTHVEQLSLTAGEWGNIHNRDMINKGLATHVVTGIEYGANAFFVFDSNLLEVSEVKEFTLKAKIVINLIFTSVESDYIQHLTEEQKSVVKKLKVKFFSDFLLEHSPATLPEAVQTYREMTKLLGERGENTVPMRVWMMPLMHLSPKVVVLVRPISVGLVLEAEETLEELDSISMRCNDCLSLSAVGKFPQLQDELNKFYKLCHYYCVELQRPMAETCPAIREGTQAESVLRRLFEQRHKSPFSQDKLTQWLQGKEREINVVQSCLDIMQGIKVLSTQAEVDSFVMAPGLAACSGFIFTSLQTSGPQLEEMGRCLEGLQMARSPVRPVHFSGQPWFYCDDTVTKVRAMAEAFSKTSGSVFVSAETKERLTGATVVTFREGQLQV